MYKNNYISHDREVVGIPGPFIEFVERKNGKEGFEPESKFVNIDEKLFLSCLGVKTDKESDDEIIEIPNELYFKPELVYTSTKSDYTSNSFKMQKVDVPVLVGLKVLGPISIFAGPSFQYILDSEFEGVSIKDIDNDLSVGLNFGIGLNLNKIGIDVRYERGLSSNEIKLSNKITDTSKFTLDSRPEQIIFSLSYRLSKKKE